MKLHGLLLSLFMLSVSSVGAMEYIESHNEANNVSQDVLDNALVEFVLTYCRNSRANMSLEPAIDLLNKGASANAHNNDPYSSCSCLHYACIYGKPALLELLLKNGATIEQESFSRTYLHTAAQYGFVDIVRLLLISGANANALDCNKFTPLYLASVCGHLDVVKLLQKKTKGSLEAVLDGAISRGCIDVVEYLFEQGANIEATILPNGMTSLCLALRINRLVIAEILLKAG